MKTPARHTDRIQTLSVGADLIVVFVQHDDDLRHVVQFSHGAQVVHRLFPLPVLLLLKPAAHKKDERPGKSDHRSEEVWNMRERIGATFEKYLKIKFRKL